MSGGGDLQISPEDLRRLGGHWVLLGEDLGDLPPHPGDPRWPSATVTAALHGQAQDANEQMAARLADSGGHVQATANQASAVDTMKAVQEMVQTVTKPLTDLSGQVGALLGQVLAAGATVMGQVVSALGKAAPASSPTSPGAGGSEEHHEHHESQEAVST